MSNEQLLAIMQATAPFGGVLIGLLLFLGVALITSGYAVNLGKAGRLRLILGGALAGAALTLTVVYATAYLQIDDGRSLVFRIGYCILLVFPGVGGFALADWFHGYPFREEKPTMRVLKRSN